MPPKKKLINSEPKTPKTPRKRGVKAKTPLKTSSSVKVKIPLLNQSTSETCQPTPAEYNARRISSQMQLNLTNEVARAQLVKNIKSEPPPTMVVAKKGKQSVLSEYFKNPKTQSTENIKEPEKKSPKKCSQSKESKVIKEKPAPKRRQADSTVRKPIKRRKIEPQTDPILQSNKTEPTINRFSPRITRSSKKKAAKAPSPSILSGLDPAKAAIDVVVPKKEKDNDSPSKEFVGPSAGVVYSRKASRDSNGSGRSWIRDISTTSSATHITVSPNEFVRFDNKLPVVKIPNIDSEVNNNSGNDDDFSSSSSSSSDSVSSRISVDEINDIGIGSVQLSTSSPSRNSSVLDKINDDSPLSKNLEKLKSAMKNIDMEIINWLSYNSEDITTELTKLKDKFLHTLQSEFGIITHCKHMKEIFHSQNNKELHDLSASDYEEVQFVKPNTQATNDLDNSVKRKCVANESSDDDDALSLFAESITGIESSRVNNSIASMSECPADEYVPKPLKSATPLDRYNYSPTKIAAENTSLRAKTVPICEKQNADSTSIYKEAAETDASSKTITDKPTKASVGTVNDDVTKGHRVNLISTQFRPLAAGQSVVFRGVCFFNMINSCKIIKNSYGQMCRFPHVMLDPKVVRDRLSKLNEEKFIQEYISIRNWSSLRRTYGTCFVDECARRELTRILVEMALDFVIKANVNCRDDLVLKAYVIETTLLYLNNVDFGNLDDLLTFCVHGDKLLIDVFIETLAQTQNFARFKQAFVKLVGFMVKRGRTFDSYVTGLILERVCFLPLDEALARSLLEVIRTTKGNVFGNSMIGHFEKQLVSLPQLYDEYLAVKRRCDMPPATSPISSCPSPSSVQLEKPDSLVEKDETAPAPLPDTTDLDNGKPTTNQPPVEPIIKRTIDFIRPPSRKLNFPPTYSIPPPSDRVIAGKPHTWRSVNNFRINQFQNMRRPRFGPRNGMMAGPLKMPTQRLVTYAETPNRYMPRRMGPQY